MADKFCTQPFPRKGRDSRPLSSRRTSPFARYLSHANAYQNQLTCRLSSPTVLRRTISSYGPLDKRCFSFEPTDFPLHQLSPLQPGFFICESPCKQMSHQPTSSFGQEDQAFQPAFQPVSTHAQWTPHPYVYTTGACRMDSFISLEKATWRLKILAIKSLQRHKKRGWRICLGSWPFFLARKEKRALEGVNRKEKACREGRVELFTWSLCSIREGLW